MMKSNYEKIEFEPWWALAKLVGKAILDTIHFFIASTLVSNNHCRYFTDMACISSDDAILIAMDWVWLCGLNYCFDTSR